jgi:hypothetical protein
VPSNLLSDDRSCVLRIEPCSTISWWVRRIVRCNKRDTTCLTHHLFYRYPLSAKREENEFWNCFEKNSVLLSLLFLVYNSCRLKRGGTIWFLFIDDTTTVPSSQFCWTTGHVLYLTTESLSNKQQAGGTKRGLFTRNVLFHQPLLPFFNPIYLY